MWYGSSFPVVLFFGFFLCLGRTLFFNILSVAVLPFSLIALFCLSLSFLETQLTFFSFLGLSFFVLSMPFRGGLSFSSHWLLSVPLVPRRCIGCSPSCCSCICSMFGGSSWFWSFIFPRSLFSYYRCCSLGCQRGFYSVVWLNIQLSIVVWISWAS